MHQPSHRAPTPQCEERGATLVQYALTVSLIAVTVISSLVQFSQSFRKLWCEQVMKVPYATTPDEISATLTWETEVNPSRPYCVVRISDEDFGASTEKLF